MAYKRIWKKRQQEVASKIAKRKKALAGQKEIAEEAKKIDLKKKKIHPKCPYPKKSAGKSTM